jgi:hypothetical protein
MPSIYFKNQCTVFQIDKTLKYFLYNNEEDFRWARIRTDGNGKSQIFSIEIPKEIAQDVAGVLLKNDNGQFSSLRKQTSQGFKERIQT